MHNVGIINHYCYYYYHDGDGIKASHGWAKDPQCKIGADNKFKDFSGFRRFNIFGGKCVHFNQKEEFVLLYITN